MISLHKHWLVADSIKERVEKKIDVPKGERLPTDLAKAAQLFSDFSALSVFYSLIYVVIEGYKELNFQDHKIDELLANEDNVSKLRRFRNGIFHFQQDPVPAKVSDFLLTKDSEDWIKQLHLSFNAWFVRELALEDVMEQARKTLRKPFWRFWR